MGNGKALADTLQPAYDAYVEWLSRQPLATRSKEAYRAQVEAYLRWLGTQESSEAALRERLDRDWAVRDYKRWVKQV